MSNFNNLNGYTVEDTQARKAIGNIKDNNEYDLDSEYSKTFNNGTEPLSITEAMVELTNDVFSSISTIEDRKASKNYTKGEQFVKDRKIYTAASDISIDDDLITVGENKNCELSKPIIEQISDFDNLPTKGSNKLTNSDSVYMLHFATDHNIIRYYQKPNGLWQVGKDVTEYFRPRVAVIPDDDYNVENIRYRLNGDNGYLPFEDLYVGDFFQLKNTISAPHPTQTSNLTEGSDWVTIAGINTYMNTGFTDKINYPHLVLVPGKGLEGLYHFGTHRMNSTNITTGGYSGSELFTTVLGGVTETPAIIEGAPTAGSTATISQQLLAEFGELLKTTPEYLTTTVTNGVSSTTTWTNCQCRLMNEVEVYGSQVFGSSGYDVGNANCQLPLFRDRRYINNGQSYWLSSVCNSTDFAVSHNSGAAWKNQASSANINVRPRFIIG